MHIYSSLGVTHNISAQSALSTKKVQSQNVAEANKLDNKTKHAQQTESFKDKLILSKQAFGFQDIAKKYDLTNISFKGLDSMLDELSENNLISYEEYNNLKMEATMSQIQGFKISENGEGYEVIRKQDADNINFSQYMEERLQYALSKNKSSHKEIEGMKEAVAILDKLTALRG